MLDRSFAEQVPANVDALKRHLSESREPERLAKARAPYRPPEVVAVRVSETPKTWAEYRPGKP